MNAKSRLKTGDLSKLSGMGREKLRFYERRGLLPEGSRTLSGHRLFAPDTVQRLRFIKDAQEAGFTLREIKELLSMSGSACGDVAQVAAQKAREVSARISGLQKMQDFLLEIAAACKRKGKERCKAIGGDLRACCPGPKKT
jgi:DNA-binding transcriptional MerR regulator